MQVLNEMRLGIVSEKAKAMLESCHARWPKSHLSNDCMSVFCTQSTKSTKLMSIHFQLRTGFNSHKLDWFWLSACTTVLVFWAFHFHCFWKNLDQTNLKRRLEHPEILLWSPRSTPSQRLQMRFCPQNSTASWVFQHRCAFGFEEWTCWGFEILFFAFGEDLERDFLGQMLGQSHLNADAFCNLIRFTGWIDYRLVWGFAFLHDLYNPTFIPNSPLQFRSSESVLTWHYCYWHSNVKYKCLQAQFHSCLPIPKIHNMSN